MRTGDPTGGVPRREFVAAGRRGGAATREPGGRTTAATDGADLLRRAAAGDRAAFETFVRRWERPLGRFLLRVAGSFHAAEEARQLTFVRVLTRASTFRGGAVSTWLFRTALRIAIDVRRSESRRATEALDDDSLPGRVPDPAATASALDERRSVRAALERLDAEDRALLWLRVADGRTFSEVAETLDVPESTARLRFVRALARLRRELERPERADAQGDGTKRGA